MDKSFQNIDEYIQGFPAEVQHKLEQIRSAIAEVAPGAVEAIKYAMPTFILKKNLVHFAAFKNHIGFYPAPSGIKRYAEELKKYKTSKGAIQIPLDEPLPLELIKEITRFRVDEELRGTAPKDVRK